MSEVVAFPPNQPPGDPCLDVSDLVQQIRESLQTECLQRGVDIEIDAPPYTMVAASRDRLDSLLRQLLLGVLRATPAGGEVVVTVYGDQGQPVEIEVASGPAESFEQFKSRPAKPQAAETEEQAAERVLAKVHRMAAAAGIEVVASACPEGGMAFTVQIPQSSDAEGSSRKAA